MVMTPNDFQEQLVLNDRKYDLSRFSSDINTDTFSNDNETNYNCKCYLFVKHMNHIMTPVKIGVPMK